MENGEIVTDLRIYPLVDLLMIGLAIVELFLTRSIDRSNIRRVLLSRMFSMLVSRYSVTGFSSTSLSYNSRISCALPNVCRSQEKKENL